MTTSIQDLRAEPVMAYLSELDQASPDSDLTSVLARLRQKGVHEVFIPEGERCSMISARDVLRISKIEQTKASTIMSRIPVLRMHSTVGDAAGFMADFRIRAIPVADGGKVIGQIRSTDILKALRGKLTADIRIPAMATPNPMTIETQAQVAKARELMLRRRIDHLPVTSGDRLTGIIVSSDILALLIPPERVGSRSVRPETRGILQSHVGDVMNSNPLTCPPETEAAFALDTMLTRESTYVLVTRWEELHAIATYRDFMRLLAEPQPEVEVPIFIVGLPDDPFEAEAAKSKFKRTVNQLRRIFPDILEARSVIKAKQTKQGKERRRYEVTVKINTGRDSFTYSDEGWELPTIYDLITDRLKRLLTQKQKHKRVREGRRLEFA